MQLTEIMFWFSSIWIIPFWILMWFLPKQEITAKAMNDIRICIFPLLIPYAILVIPNLPHIFITLGSDMPTPQLVIDFFQDDEVIIIGWLHFLAFDLLAGRYIWKRMVALDRPIYVSTPILILSMMAAPLGFLIGLVSTWNNTNLNMEVSDIA